MYLQVKYLRSMPLIETGIGVVKVASGDTV
jgi:hypothetical protein